MKHTMPAAAALVLIVASATANAAVYEASFENNLGSQTIANSVTTVDVLVMSGLLTSGAGSVINSTTFTTGAGVQTISLDAVWRSGAAGDTLRLVGVNIDLLDSSSAVIASDAFTGVLSGFAHSSVDFGGLIAGSVYTIRLTGTNTNVGQYLVDASFAAVPLPATVSMLIPALLGLGALSRRHTLRA